MEFGLYHPLLAVLDSDALAMPDPVRLDYSTYFHVCSFYHALTFYSVPLIIRGVCYLSKHLYYWCYLHRCWTGFFSQAQQNVATTRM